mmetsp:Transcript_62767/g.181986  ORF Transcript_62767/g.181986 Transcript_62767/m.181986 type:complete len:246 (-) Transcript_62767:200-937(-)
MQVKIRAPSGENFWYRSPVLSPFSMRRHSPVFAFHIAVVRPSTQVMTKEPSGENLALFTAKRPWPQRVRMQFPESVRQSFVEASLEPVRARPPRGEKSQQVTAAWWPRRMCLHSLLSLLHIFAVWSPDAVRTNEPSGENAAAFTTAPWPSRTPMHSPRLLLQSLAAPSSEAVSTQVPSGEKSADLSAAPCMSKLCMSLPESAPQICAALRDAVRMSRSVNTTDNDDPSQTPNSFNVLRPESSWTP